MIKCENGSCKISGSTIEILTDFVVVVKGISKTFSEDIGDENAKDIVKKCFEIGMMKDEEIEVRSIILNMMINNPKELKWIIDELSKRGED